MWKSLLLTLFSLSFIQVSVLAQNGRHYRVDETKNIEALEFTLTASSGSCTIKPSTSKHPINIFGDPENEKVTPAFKTWREEDIQKVSFVLQPNEPLGIGKKLSYSMFSENAAAKENLWHIYVSESLPILFNLNYGIGHADIDLSGLSIKNLKINTGSADVNLGYLSGKSNKIAMDTLMVKVDMGNLNVGNLNLSRAKTIIAEVGFGSLFLDFSKKNSTKSHISASVGAGNLEISIPSSQIPILVNIYNSPLCRIKLSNDFKEISENVFANESYSANAPDLLTFDLDVALGKITFVKK